MAKLNELLPEQTKAYFAFHKEVFKDGEIDKKTKELIAIAVGNAILCEPCIESHAQKARALGCTDKQIAEAIAVAAAVRTGSVLTHAEHAFPEE
ncbi:carboxymuconolactone decarboxylase family protein [Candidatus Woesearchaeota archaeon]|nr:carboxymuconolactone decarboxylase family protein [Candidatus Woesearchaeota archaeon]